MNFRKYKPIVESKAVSEFAYDESRKLLRVRFTSGATYEYPGVPRELVEQMQIAQSIGSFVGQHVRPHYTGKLVIVDAIDQEAA